MRKGTLLVLFSIMFLMNSAVSFASTIATLEMVSPISTVFTLVDDFYPFDFTAVGDVTANLEYVAGEGDAVDFTNFTRGNIALIERGSITFSEKVSNAFDAGAVGAIIYNYIVADNANFGTLMFPGDIPAVSVTNDVGLSFKNLLDQGNNVVIHMATYTSRPSDVPEPSTMLLLGSGLLGLVGLNRRRKA